MRIVIEQGNDQQYRPFLQDDDGEVLFVPSINLAYATGGEAADFANGLLAKISREGIEGIYTESGERWYF